MHYIIFLKGTYKLADGSDFVLHTELRTDQFVLMVLLSFAIDDANKTLHLVRHIYESLEKSEGQLPDMNSARELFYNSARKWCQQHYSIPQKEFFKEKSGKQLVDLVELISSKINQCSRPVKLLFSGTKISEQTKELAREETKQILVELTQKGMAESGIMAYVIGKALKEQDIQWQKK